MRRPRRTANAVADGAREQHQADFGWRTSDHAYVIAATSIETEQVEVDSVDAILKGPDVINTIRRATGMRRGPTGLWHHNHGYARKRLMSRIENASGMLGTWSLE
jgi:hypothetical protein